jgi:hypothetical protein
MRTFFRIWLKGAPLLAVVMVALAACGSNAAPAATTTLNADKTGFTFPLVASSAAIKSCLSHNPRGTATITKVKNEDGDVLNEILTLNVYNLAPNTGYDLFVIEIPHAPFGISWYQSDLQTDHDGDGSVRVQGIFNVETFSVSQQGSPTVSFGATHQYHLGLWFNDPNVPFKLGCEPGKTSAVVTPFNGEQHAGIQVLNTSTFPDNAGPLSHVSA